ncbi:MAG: hypothetical protein IJ662_07000 [Clostridia bacterium]|nr:hypothetical protein [Clostridia bacterium]
MKRIILWLCLAALMLCLTGCRARVTGKGPAGEQAAQASGNGGPGGGQAGGALDADAQPLPEGDEGDKTRENPDADRKEYDEAAEAEILPGAEGTLHGPGSGDGADQDANEGDADPVSKLREEAERAARLTVAAQEAERLGVSESAAMAETALTYYQVLLQDRLGGLMECKRQYVYWETAQDHVTVYKKSPEHQLITQAGAYDVSARLLEENLRVDDGWVARKNPGVIVKAVDPAVLGGGVEALAPARAAYQALLSRPGWQGVDAVKAGRVLLLSQEALSTPYLQTAAALYIAKIAAPTLFEDVDPAEALAALMGEATGYAPQGTYFYTE